MRIVVVIAGVVLILVWALFQFVPLAPQPVNPISTAGETPFEMFTVGGFSLTGTIPVSISWSASTIVTVVAAACPQACTNSNVSTLSDITEQSGISGSFTLNQPNGGGIILVVVSSAHESAGADFTIITGLSTEAALTLFVGVAFLIAGVVLKRPQSLSPAPAPSMMPIPPPTPPPIPPTTPP